MADLADLDTTAMTPMLRQFFDMKRQCPDAVLLFRMGDFYEIFGDDAEDVAPKLDLVLTSRERGDKNRIPFCGVPHHSAKSYWIKLLRMGYRVAIAEQMENPEEAKGLVRREITRVFTPGCIDELEGLESDAPNYLAAIYEVPSSRRWVVALCDVSTGEFRLGNVSGREEALALVQRHRPKELLVRKAFLEDVKTDFARYLSVESLLFTALPEGILRDQAGQAALIQQSFAAPLAHLPCGEVEGGVALVGAVLSYFASLQASTAAFMTVKPLVEPQFMVFDETARRDLEIFETVRRRQVRGSLFGDINMTLTPMGARLLRRRLAAPFLDAADIQCSLDAVTNIMSRGDEFCAALRRALQQTPDIDRLTSRLLARSLNPGELFRLKQSLERAVAVAAALGRGEDLPADLQKAHRELMAAKEPLASLNGFLSDQAGMLGQELTVIREGYHADFDRLRTLAKNGAREVESYEERLRRETGIGSLKVKFHKSFGFLIEITKSNLQKTPPHFIRRQTMVNCERFVTPDLMALGESLEKALDNAVAEEARLYGEFLAQMARHGGDLRAVGEALALIDLSQSFAYLAVRRRLVRPRTATDSEMLLRNARHLVVESFVGADKFVPNDVRMGASAKQLLITGPNMAGKSTVMRQVALCAVMHQIGCFVPAEEAIMPVFDRIFTRVGAADDLSSGQSTFMVEMSEAATILRQATAKSLVILDEVGRGTSTEDGLAIAAAIAEELATRVKAYSLFATHYHELVDIARHLPAVACVQTEVLPRENGVTFTHRLVPGSASSSFGIEVARRAGLPERVIQQASHYLSHHQQRWRQGATTMATVVPIAVKEPSMDTLEGGGLRRFTDLREKLRAAKINRMTPLDALNFLNELKGLVEETKAPTGLLFD